MKETKIKDKNTVLKSIYCNCHEFKGGRQSWIANVDENSYMETQCRKCRQCVTIKNGEIENILPMRVKFLRGS